MLRKRFHKWGLDNKKNNEPEMRAMARKGTERMRIGRVSTFRARDRTVQYKDVVRYWKRRGLSMEDVLTQITSREPTPEGLEVLTPVPSSVTPPTTLEIPERFLKGVNDYIRASFESRTWFSDSDESYCRSSKTPSRLNRTNLDRIFNSVRVACGLFRDGKAQEAGQTLLYSTAILKEVVESEHPDILPLIFMMFFHSLHYEVPGVAIAVTQQFVLWGQFLLGRNHPIPQLLCLFTNKDDPHMQEFLVTGLRSMRDCFEDRLGFYHKTTLRVSSLYYESMLSDEDQLHLLRTDLDRLMLKLPAWDPRCLGMHLDLISAYLQMGIDEIAEDECIGMLRACCKIRDEIKRAFYEAHVSSYQAFLQGLRENYDAAETLWNKAIAQIITVAGERRTTPQRWRRFLEDLLVRTGQTEKAALVKQQRLAVLAREMEELQEIEGPLAELF